MMGYWNQQYENFEFICRSLTIEMLLKWGILPTLPNIPHFEIISIVFMLLSNIIHIVDYVIGSSIPAQFFLLENLQPFLRYFKKAWKHVSANKLFWKLFFQNNLSTDMSQKRKLQFSQISIRINAKTFIHSILKCIDKRCVAHNPPCEFLASLACGGKRKIRN